MKATEKEIKKYIKQLFMHLELDWNGYLGLRELEKECIKKGEIIFLK
jgi:hypothetical protein